MQTVTGTNPSETASAKFCLSMPAENESGRPPPNASRRRATSWIASTCSGGPERYMTFSPAGKKLRWFSTIRVLVSLTPKPRPTLRAVCERRPMNSTACSQRASFSNAASGICSR